MRGGSRDQGGGCPAASHGLGWAGLRVTRVLFQRVFPYISVMVNNGSLSYDHSKDGRWTELAGCTADFRNRDHDTFLAVRYSRGRLTVSGREGRLWGGSGRWAGRPQAALDLLVGRR